MDHSRLTLTLRCEMFSISPEEGRVQELDDDLLYRGTCVYA
jgi:hypothetical protein